jgi:hypothetical protein
MGRKGTEQHRVKHKKQSKSDDAMTMATVVRKRTRPVWRQHAKPSVIVGNISPRCSPPPRKLLYFIPAIILVLERLWVPFEFDNVIHVQTQAVTIRTKSLLEQPTSNLQKPLPSLSELTNEPWLTACPNGLKMMLDVQLPDSHSLETQKRIPKIVHQTSKSRCLTSTFTNIASKWKLEGWSYYFHDDAALERLFQTEFAEFPHMQAILRNCVLTNGTIKADLWRYLILWLYGGVYADVDSTPNEFGPDTIGHTDDAFFVVEQYHVLSQWFMGVSPRHPLMYYAIHYALLNLLEATDTQQVDAAFTTGPHALHRAYQEFRKDFDGFLVDPVGNGFKPVQSGNFMGTNNRSVTVVGVGENQNQYVRRMALDPLARTKDYKAMGMKHFSKFKKINHGKESGISCLAALRSETFVALK